jgi:photosystem II stability/assembly factor-like uncharacterized protein
MNSIRMTFASTIRLLLVIFAMSQYSIAQWQQTNGPYGGDVNCFAVSGTNIFAGTPANGVYFSSDNGSSWNEVNNGLSDLNVRALAVSGWNLFAGTPSGVFYSTDNGSSWTDVNNGLTNTDVYSLTISGTDLFAGCDSKRVFLSTDYGTSWTDISIGVMGGNYVRAIAKIGSNLFAGTEGNGLFRSTDNGMNWKPANGSLKDNTLIRAIETDWNGSIFVETQTSIFRSDNEGKSWKALNFTPPGNLLSMVVSGSNIFTGQQDDAGVYRSTDEGESWSLTSLRGVSVRSFAVIGNEVFAGTHNFSNIGGRGIFLTADNGTTWTEINNGLDIITTNVRTFAADNTYLYTGTDIGVFYSADGGMNWEPTPWYNFTSILTVNSSGIFTATGAAVYLSTDNGSSWSFVHNLLASITTMTSMGTDLYAGTTSPTYGDVWRSTDNGGTWISSGLTNVNVYSLAVSNSNLFASVHRSDTPPNAVLFSTDNGASWTDITAGLPNQEFRVLVADGTNLFACTGNNGGIWFTSDNGASWTDISISSISSAVSSIIVSGTNLFAGTRGEGVFISTDSGNNWDPANTGLTNGLIPSLFISGSNLLAATNGNGVWSRPLSEMMSKSVSSSFLVAPDQFSLEQNYPNPFNPTTTIRYSIPRNGHVNLSVYNLLGEEAAVLVNENIEAGVHEVTFKAAALPSGVYFYQLTAGDFVQTEKMILLR